MWIIYMTVHCSQIICPLIFIVPYFLILVRFYALFLVSGHSEIDLLIFLEDSNPLTIPEKLYQLGICKVTFFWSRSRSKFLFGPGPGPGLNSMSVKNCIIVKNRVRRDRVFSPRSRSSPTRQKSVSIPVPAKYSLGILVPIPPSTNKTPPDFNPSKIFPRDSIVPIPLFNSDTRSNPVLSGQRTGFLSRSQRDRVRVQEKIGFGTVSPDSSQKSRQVVEKF